MAVVVVCSTVCASAPVKLLVICTVGGVISGYWLIGIFRIASVPTSKITREMTIAVTGLLRNIFEEFIIVRILKNPIVGATVIARLRHCLFRGRSPARCSRLGRAYL